MATFGEIESNISTMLNRSDLSLSIQLAIKKAIEHYENEYFDFNEDTFTRTLSATTSVYTLTGSMSLITQIISAKLTVNGTEQDLRQRSIQHLDHINTDNSQGEPTIYSVFGNAIRVYPRPDSNYTLSARCNRKYSTLSASTDTNPWTVYASQLIEARAIWWLSMTKLRDPEMAAQAKTMEVDEYNKLQERSTLKVSSGKITSTEF